LSVGLVIPTLNPGAAWSLGLERLHAQSLCPDRILVIDSSSTDATVNTAKTFGCEVIVIERSKFNHGTTRQLAAELLADMELIVFMTQDALLADSDTIAQLISSFSDARVGCAYGRQLPHKNAHPIGAHARLFNYPETSFVRALKDSSRLGIKAAFISNSFAAYRRSALMEVGGFPPNIILSEDTFVAAKMLLVGWKVAYCAEAKVFHSHDYSSAQEFRRYFDIGVFHAREAWIRFELGNAEQEGIRFVLSEVQFLIHHAPWLIPSALFRTGLKYTGYRLGLIEHYLPVGLKQQLSMHRQFWQLFKRILIYGINYFPELTGIGKYSGEMAGWLAAHGYEVRVVTAPPYYPEWHVANSFSSWRYRREKHAKVLIWRCPLWVPARPSGIKRVLHLISFSLSSLPVMLKQIFWKPDVVMVIEPPLMCAPAALLVARLSGGRAWLHVQDFEVDAAFDLGLLPAGFMRTLVLGVERILMRAFDRVSTISGNMVARLFDKQVKRNRCVLFLNWVDTDVIYPLSEPSPMRVELDICCDIVVALYSGNMGEKQGLEIVLETAHLLVDEPLIRFVMCGDGAAKARLHESFAYLANVLWLPLQPVEKLNDLLNMADVHLLPQRADVADLVMPSKLTGMLASGRPILATACPETQVAQLVSQCGVVTPPGDAEAFARELLALAKNPSARADLGEQARKYAVANIGKDAILVEFEENLRAA
jgi:colanic acid biosynthesis glycosyl transferase WcaI